METHYSNPNIVVGQLDVGSGFRLHMAPTLRKNNIGVLNVGGIPTNQTSVQIPPGMARYNETFVCPESCLGDSKHGISSDGITVLMIMSHMHLRGESSFLQQYRNGKEISSLQSMPYFDFNFQTGLFKPNNTKIFPTDTLISKCAYNTLADNQPITFGYTSENEM